MNRFVTGLEKEHFKVFEDKVEQDIRSSRARTHRYRSGSSSIPAAVWGANSRSPGRPSRSSLRPLIPRTSSSWSSSTTGPSSLSPSPRNTEEIQNRLTFTQVKGTDGAAGWYLPGHESDEEGSQSAQGLLVISDGGDNSSRYTESEIKNAVREADVQVYAIGIFEPMGAALPNRRGNVRPGIAE